MQIMLVKIYKTIALVFGLYILLYMYPKGRFCILGIHSYFTIGLLLVIASWVIAFRILNGAGVWWRTAGVMTTVVLSFLSWIWIMNLRGFHALCW